MNYSINWFYISESGLGETLQMDVFAFVLLTSMQSHLKTGFHLSYTCNHLKGKPVKSSLVAICPSYANTV